jgi:quercetin dioxygenase-like cupin family protein
MLLARPMVVKGVNWGAIYTLEKEGDVFPEHVHTPQDNHITILAYGAVRITAGKHKGKTLRAIPGGMIVVWEAGDPHGFVALEDGTTLVHIQEKIGQC